MSYIDLELTLRRWSDDDGSYALDLRFEAAGSRAVARSIEGPLPRLQIDLDALQDPSADLHAYGQRLTQLLFADPRLSEMFEQAREQAESAQIPLRLRLRLDTTDEGIHRLLWETLQDPGRGGFLCASERLLVSRYLESEEMAALPARPRAKLKALVAVANPDRLESYKLAPVDISGEVERCQAALAEIPTTILAQGYGQRATLNNLAAALRDAPDILYLVCHGTTRDGQPYLWLEDEDGAIGRIDGAEFVSALERLEQRPSLIVLASCRSAGHSQAAGALAALGPQLAAAGIAAVVAMQGDITMETVAAFMPTFFSELLRDGRIDRALAAARAGVLGRPDWWMPVLFLRVQDGMLWSEPDLPAPPEPQRPPEVAAFVGREAELADFTQQLATEHLAIITGMPGVGKTMLAAKVASQAADAPKIFWHTFHEDEGVDIIIWKLAGFLARNQQEDLWRMLERARQTGGQPPPPEVLLDYLVQLLRGHSYLLCLDDFHLVDHDPLLDQFVERLRAELRDGKIALLIMSRQMPAFAQEEAMALEGLSADDTNLLLVARGLDLSPDLAAELHTHTGGNPQILTLAIDRLLRSRDPAALIARLSEVDNIERYLMAEVDADLSEDERAVMGAVAVLLGYGGTRAAIEAMLDRGSLRRTLGDLSDRYLLLVGENDTGRLYSQHAVVQAFYYDSLPKSERQAMHRRAGAYYETEEPDALRAARHFERAQEHSQAASLVTGNFWALMNQGQARTLRQLLERFTAQQMETRLWVSVCIAQAEVYMLLGESQPARERFQAALAQLDTLPDTPAIRERRARVYRGLSVLSQLGGSYDQAAAECQAGLELLADCDLPNHEVARLYAQLAEVFFHHGHYDDAASACRKGLAALPAEPAAPRERALLYQRLATVDGQHNKYRDAIPTLERSLQIAYQVGDPALIAKIANNLGAYLNYAGQKDRALERYQESLRFRQQLGDAAGQAVTVMNQGGVYQELGDYDAALKCFIETRDLSARLNLPNRWATAVLNIGIVQYLRGQWDAAKDSFLQAEAVFSQHRNKNYLASCHYRLGDVALAQHDPAAAQRHGEQALVCAQAVGSTAYEFSALRVIFEALLAQGWLNQAAEYLEQARQVQARLDEPSYHIRMHIAVARLELARKQYEQALAFAQQALSLAREQKLPNLIAMAEALCAQIADSTERGA